MSYLTSYRTSAVEKYGNTGGRQSNPPKPYQPFKPPGAANDNSPRPANDNVRKAEAIAKGFARLTPVGRAIVRRNPWMNALFTGYDLWRLINGSSQVGVGQFTMAGWTTCLGPCPGVDAPTHVIYQAFGVCTGCLNDQFTGTGIGGVGPRDLASPPPANAVGMQLFKYSHLNLVGAALFDTYAKATRPGGSASKQPPQTRVWRAPQRNVVLDPNLLPIQMAMPLPLPIPLALAPHRLNDPIGSTRTYGETVKLPPRRPPGEGKEVKLRANSIAGLRVLIGLAHFGTELVDYVDAFHDALPKGVQAKPSFHDGKWWKATPQAKAEAVYRNLSVLDWNAAVGNLIMNEIGDRILGRANAAANKALNQAPGGRVTRGIAF